MVAARWAASPWSGTDDVGGPSPPYPHGASSFRFGVVGFCLDQRLFVHWCRLGWWVPVVLGVLVGLVGGGLVGRRRSVGGVGFGSLIGVGWFVVRLSVVPVTLGGAPAAVCWWALGG